MTGSIAALLILLTTILLWLLPFPPSSVAEQLDNSTDRLDLRARLGAEGPFVRFLDANQRFAEWLGTWFGPRWSGQSFERCVAIAFVFPVALFLLATVLYGYKHGQISFGALLLFLFGVVMVSMAVRWLFRLVYWFARRMWRSIGGDSELAELIARILLGAFAVVFAFAIAFAVASSLAGNLSDVGTVAFAILGGFAFALAFAIAFAFAGIWAFLIALVLVTVIALTMAKQFAFFLLLFFVILPVMNAMMDWVSWAVTRFHLSIMARAYPGATGAAIVAGVLIADVTASILLVASLAILLPIGLELADVFLSVFGRDSFDWRPVAAQAVKSPWNEGLFVTGMLLTPLVPTIAMLTMGLVSLAAPLTPGAERAVEAISDHPEVRPSVDEIREISNAVYLSRLWYAPALLISIGVFVGIWGALYLSGIPTAQLLQTLALCSTVWSHGECAW
ncbi:MULTISPECIES: hypothetical protein [Rhodomicrobium]|uniref:hypothetical protein n=1 Tax=Rhodomicrobium TaxID=1068 RepID=UPI000F73576A|nr:MULTISPECIES: hypothetical protein [Rhodomicrobium]